MRMLLGKTIIGALCALTGPYCLALNDFSIAIDAESIAITQDRDIIALSVDYDLTNSDVTSSESGDVVIKGFLLPTEIAQGSHSVKGVTLPTVALTYQGNPRSRSNYKIMLPSLREGKYLLGLIANTHSSVPEADQLNNVSQLVELTLPNIEGQRYGDDVDFDFYTEITDLKLTPINGGMQHGLRTIVRGDNQLWPNEDLGDEALWGRFLLYSPSAKKVYPLIYAGDDPSAIEKQWGAMAYNDELDAQGQPIHVDYYSQSPIFKHVPPGDYYFVTMINTREIVKENDYSNNLDLEPVTINRISPSISEIWTVSHAGSKIDRSFHKKIYVLDHYGFSSPWQAEVLKGGNWLGLVHNTGAFENSTAEIQATIDIPEAPGVYEADLRIATGEGAFAGSTDVSVKHFRYQGVMPVLNIDKTSFQVEFADDEFIKDFEITIGNSGSAPLVWKLLPNEQVRWLHLLSASEGTLAPRSEETIRIRIDRNMVQPGWYDAQINLLTSSQSFPLQLQFRAIIPWILESGEETQEDESRD